jgi:hypothetical protein
VKALPVRHSIKVSEIKGYRVQDRKIKETVLMRNNTHA